MSSLEYSQPFPSLRTDDLIASLTIQRLSDFSLQSKQLRDENVELKNCLRVLRENTDVPASNLISSVIGWNTGEKAKEIPAEILRGPELERSNLSPVPYPPIQFQNLPKSYSPSSSQRNMSAYPRSDDRYQVLGPPEYVAWPVNGSDFGGSERSLSKLSSVPVCGHCNQEPESPGKTPSYLVPPDAFSDTASKISSTRSSGRAGPKMTSTPKSGHRSPKRSKDGSKERRSKSPKEGKTGRTKSAKASGKAKKSRSPSPASRGSKNKKKGSERSSRSISRTNSPLSSDRQGSKEVLPGHETDGRMASNELSPRNSGGVCDSCTRHSGGTTPAFHPINSVASICSSCSGQHMSLLPGSRSSSQHYPIIAVDSELVDDGESYPQSYRILGEIAFQLERRILDYVFCGDKSKLVGSRGRRRFYGYTVNNIPVMISKEAEGEDGEVDQDRDQQIRSRLQRITQTLASLGYNMDKHSVVSQKIINKYGLLGTIPHRSTMDAFGMNDDDTLRSLVKKITCDDEERKNMMILVECLLLLARQDGKPILLW
ncbi:uncharacterized protein LOC121388854 [Gigantopelta aegis]|uniref:uncharacterized protein LOC121388854 n=1 Tax=Gigantopelta aegis TaxID=1735272 RepID=UPI001B88C92E|nr:uncharacterized protein LOC121388854 [Gigantopelta aegis]